jgi:hypothetical protein
MSPLAPLLGSMPSDETDAATVRLRCLAGSAAPDDIVREAGRVARLSPSSRAQVWTVLYPCVMQPMNPELADRLSQFCLRHEVAEADLGHVVRIARWLLRESASADASLEDFTTDVAAVFGESDGFGAALTERYEAIKGELRRQLLAESLIRHGKVLDDVDWRIDEVSAERHAADLQWPIALVTFAYRDQDAKGRLTLQMTTEQLGRLAEVFAALAQRTKKA